MFAWVLLTAWSKSWTKVPSASIPISRRHNGFCTRLCCYKMWAFSSSSFMKIMTRKILRVHIASSKCIIWWWMVKHTKWKIIRLSDVCIKIISSSSTFTFSRLRPLVACSFEVSVQHATSTPNTVVWNSCWVAFCCSISNVDFHSAIVLNVIKVSIKIVTSINNLRIVIFNGHPWIFNVRWSSIPSFWSSWIIFGWPFNSS